MSRKTKKRLVKRLKDKILKPWEPTVEAEEYIPKPYTKAIKGSYITPAKRAANKEADGKPVRLLTKAERRFVARANRYARKTGTPVDLTALVA